MEIKQEWMPSLEEADEHFYSLFPGERPDAPVEPVTDVGAFFTKALAAVAMNVFETKGFEALMFYKDVDSYLRKFCPEAPIMEFSNSHKIYWKGPWKVIVPTVVAPVMTGVCGGKYSPNFCFLGTTHVIYKSQEAFTLENVVGANAQELLVLLSAMSNALEGSPDLDDGAILIGEDFPVIGGHHIESILEQVLVFRRKSCKLGSELLKVPSNEIRSYMKSMHKYLKEGNASNFEIKLFN